MNPVVELWKEFLERESLRVEEAGDLLCRTLLKGKKVLIAGNGGSATQASHFAAELAGNFAGADSPQPAISLSSDTGLLTALANDYGFSSVFLRQLRALSSPGDLFVALSTGGSSPNIVEAVRYAKQAGIAVVSLIGAKPSPLESLSDITVRAPTVETPRIQEIHLYVLHTLAGFVEERVKRGNCEQAN